MFNCYNPPIHACCALQAEENKDEHMDEMLKKIKEHEAYVSKVSFARTSQPGLSNTVARSFADLTAELRVWLAFTLGYPILKSTDVLSCRCVQTRRTGSSHTLPSWRSTSRWVLRIRRTILYSIHKNLNDTKIGDFLLSVTF